MTTATRIAPPQGGHPFPDRVAPCALAAADRASLRVGLLGCGVVGSAVAARLSAGADLASDIPRLELARVAVRTPHKARPGHVSCPITTDAGAVAVDPDIDVVVEAMGGVEPARSLVLEALRDGKSVVTANKELVATHGDELADAARRRGVAFRYGAAVCAAVPVLESVGALEAAVPTRIDGILNGTTNYVLGRMARFGVTLEDALAEAKERGYAEPDPQRDVDGRDAAAKAAILAAAAFGAALTGSPRDVEGISAISPADVAAASSLGYTLKLVATIVRRSDGVEVRVGPTAVPGDHPLARVEGCDNGLVIHTRAGAFVVQGPGAGGAATAAAILGDVAAVARSYRSRVVSERPARAPRVPVRSGSAASAYLIRSAGRDPWTTPRVDEIRRRELLRNLAENGTPAAACLPALDSLTRSS